MRKLEIIIAIVGVIIAAISLIPAFGQWLSPREPRSYLAPPGLAISSQDTSDESYEISEETPLISTPIPEPTNTPHPTVAPTRTRTSPPTPAQSCLTPNFFQAVQEAYPQLGCPTNSLTSDFTFQSFQGGMLAWQKSPNPSTIYAFFDNGRWEKQADPGGPPEPSCLEAEQIGRLGPIFGFGKLWCQNRDWRERLGIPIDEEKDGKNNQIQNFENGTILTIGAAGGFILYSNSQWTRF